MTAGSGLGYVQRLCDDCGAEWGPKEKPCPRCGGRVLTERVVEPEPFMLGKGLRDVVRAILPAPPKPMILNAEDRAVLRDASQSAEAFLVALRAADEVLRRAANQDGVTEQIWRTHEQVVRALGSPSDATSASSLTPFGANVRHIAWALGLLVEEARNG